MTIVCIDDRASLYAHVRACSTPPMKSERLKAGGMTWHVGTEWNVRGSALVTANLPASLRNKGLGASDSRGRARLGVLMGC